MCSSDLEISQAEELGAEIVKIFPGNAAGGPSFVKAVRGPSPWTSIMPTGGVEPTEKNLKEWFDAGVTCVGMGSGLITASHVKKAAWNEITAKVRETLEIIRNLRAAEA